MGYPKRTGCQSSGKESMMLEETRNRLDKIIENLEAVGNIIYSSEKPTTKELKECLDLLISNHGLMSKVKDDLQKIQEAE